MEIFRIVLVVVLLTIAFKLSMKLINKKKSLKLEPTIKKQVYENIDLSSRKNNDYNVIKYFDNSKELEDIEDLIVFKGLSLVEEPPTTKAYTSDSHWSSSDSSSSDNSSSSSSNSD